MASNVLEYDTAAIFVALLFIVIFNLISPMIGDLGSSGSIVSDYGLDDRAIDVRSPAGAKDFSSILCVQTGSGAHPASCTVGTGGPFPGGKSAAGECIGTALGLFFSLMIVYVFRVVTGG
jgi:hypothetical protein